MSFLCADESTRLGAQLGMLLGHLCLPPLIFSSLFLSYAIAVAGSKDVTVFNTDVGEGTLYVSYSTDANAMLMQIRMLL